MTLTPQLIQETTSDIQQAVYTELNPDAGKRTARKPGPTD